MITVIEVPSDCRRQVKLSELTAPTVAGVLEHFALAISQKSNYLVNRRRFPPSDASTHELHDGDEIVIPDDPDFINFGSAIHAAGLGQTQYASYALMGIGGKPNLGQGLRYTDGGGNYHAIRIHKDDLPIFLQRYREYCKSRM